MFDIVVGCEEHILVSREADETSRKRGSKRAEVSCGFDFQQVWMDENPIDS